MANFFDDPGTKPRPRVRGAIPKKCEECTCQECPYKTEPKPKREEKATTEKEKVEAPDVPFSADKDY